MFFHIFNSFELHSNAVLHVNHKISPIYDVTLENYLAQSAGAVEYTDCTSAEG